MAIPIYNGLDKDITDGCIGFYSPRSMKPAGRQPSWANNMEEVIVEGVDLWHFRFYR